MKSKLLFITLVILMTSCKQHYTTQDIYKAINTNNTDKLQDILEHINLDTLILNNNRTLIHESIVNDASSKFILTCIDKSSDSLINKKDAEGFLPIHMAFIKDRTDIIEALIPKTTDINTTDKNNYAPIHYAILQEQNSIFDKLIKSGANINLKGAYNQTPLHLAAIFENVIFAKKLQQLNAIDTIKDVNQDTPKDIALESKNKAFINLFFKQFSDKDKNILLRNLIIKSNDTIDLIEKYIKQNWVKPITINDAFVLTKSIKASSFLLKEGVDVNQIHSDFGVSALHWACICGDTTMISHLLNHGADINQISQQKRTPLMYAAQLNEESNDLVDELNKYDLTVNLNFLNFIEVSEDKNQENSMASVKLLLSKGAKINYISPKGENALIVAEETNNKPVAELLLKHGIKRLE